MAPLAIRRETIEVDKFNDKVAYTTADGRVMLRFPDGAYREITFIEAGCTGKACLDIVAWLRAHLIDCGVKIYEE